MRTTHYDAYSGGHLVKGKIMKKFLLVFCLIIILSLCSCRKINQPDTNHTDSNLSDLSSDLSSITSDMILPETSDSVSSQIISSRPEPDESSGSSTTSDEISANAKLSIDVDNPYYKTSVKTISFTIYNEYKGKFNFYSDFFLQRYENGNWKYCTTLDGEINYQFKTIESDSHVASFVLDLRNLYQLPLPTGTYRIIQETDDAVITSKSFEIVDNSFFGGEQDQ